jgi:hypothetical protein
LGAIAALDLPSTSVDNETPRAVAELRFPGSAVFEIRSQLKREDPLNLSILVRGGKETNKDSLSNGE